MAELTTADVETFTRGRLSAGDPVVQDILNAALVRARNYTGWVVSPQVADDAVTIDGPGGRELFLPTGRRMVYRKNTCWTSEFAGITVTYTHGYTEEEAADWRRAILLMVDRMSREQQSGARSKEDLVRKKVDVVEYQWVDWSAAADRAITSVESMLDHYQLAPSGFA